MEIPQQAVLLRIFIGEDDKVGSSPLYEAIVLKARELHLAGATVLRGGMGFGHSSRLHTTKILRLSEDLPLVIEIVDAEDKINSFLPVLDGMMGSGLITLKSPACADLGDSVYAGAVCLVPGRGLSAVPVSGGRRRHGARARLTPRSETKFRCFFNGQGEM